MTDPRPRVRLSADTIAPGEVVEVRARILHPMETGNRSAPDGTTVPRNIVHGFRADLDGRTVFTASFDTAVSADPYLQFHVAPDRSGTLTLTWSADDGQTVTVREAITVA